jgi:Flp pilus assembly secretin CpaC
MSQMTVGSPFKEMVRRKNKVATLCNIYRESQSMKYAPLAILTFISLFLAAGELDAQSNTALEDTENVLVYPSIPVVVNKSVVVRLPRKANKVFVTQPQVAEVVVVAPDQLLINGKAVGATSLVVWFEEKTKARKQ